jgi:hypothetical protein
MRYVWKKLLFGLVVLKCSAGFPWVYEDDFKGADMTLDFRTTSRENMLWVADPQLVVQGQAGMVRPDEVGVYYAALPLLDLTEKSVVQLDLTLRLWRAKGEKDSSFAFGFSPLFPTRLYSEGSALTIIQSMTGNIQVASGKGLAGRLTDGWVNPWAGFDEEKPFSLHYVYSIPNGTVSLAVKQGEYEKTVLDNEKVNWTAPGVPVSLYEMNYLLFMFNKQSISGASGYIKHLRLEVTE